MAVQITIPDMYWRELPLMKAVIAWLQLAGWAAVDNLIFALVQAILLLIALRQRPQMIDDGETAPLLS